MIRALRYLGLAIVFVWFFFGGIFHFARPESFLQIMPPYVPLPLAAVYVSGACELLFALGIVPPATRQLSGNLLMLLTVAVTPANVHMWLHPELFPDAPLFLVSIWRLVLQVVLLALIWWSTRPPAAAEARTA
jgi:uncharacterized membrane protein